MARTSPLPVPLAPATADHVSIARAMLPPSAVVPDEGNRRVVEDEDFELLCDSIRVSGVLQPLQVWRRPDGSHRLIDGERRWRAAQKLGLKEVPCEVWPSDADTGRIAVAGLALNEHRKAHGCLHVARRLRDIKNERAFSHAQLAEHTGLPLDRVKTYFSLFVGSDDMLEFLEENEVPLRVAVELVRYERATNEARARTIAKRYLERPLSVQEIVALRKREQAREQSMPESAPDRNATKMTRLLDRLASTLRHDPSALGQLEDFARRLGYQLVPTSIRAEG
jgi:ParB family chromosome partitioning protein